MIVVAASRVPCKVSCCTADQTQRYQIATVSLLGEKIHCILMLQGTNMTAPS